MNKLNALPFLFSKRVLLPCLAAMAACVLSIPAAQATPYVVKLTEQGNNVVASGSGAFDLTGLTLYFHAGTSSSGGMFPSLGFLDTAPSAVTEVDFYTGFHGPTSYGGGELATATGGNGDVVAIIGNPSLFTLPLLLVPSGYVSGTALSSTATWDNATFASLGVTPGTYEWAWGSGADQSFTLDIGNVTSVPEPAALGMFGFGLLLVGVFAGSRRRALPAPRAA